MLDINKTRDVEVTRVCKEIDWMDIKYGHDVAPAKFVVTLNQQEGTSDGTFKNAKEQMIIYKYKKTSFNGI